MVFLAADCKSVGLICQVVAEWFDSTTAHLCGVAQLVEQVPVKDKVGGSSPPTTACSLPVVVELTKATLSQPGESAVFWTVAQFGRVPDRNPGSTGSSPVGPTCKEIRPKGSL